VFGGEEELVIKGYSDASFQTMLMILNRNLVLCSTSMEGQRARKFQARYSSRFEDRG
jgi:hypothetical protein